MRGLKLTVRGMALVLILGVIAAMTLLALVLPAEAQGQDNWAHEPYWRVVDLKVMNDATIDGDLTVTGDTTLTTASWTSLSNMTAVGDVTAGDDLVVTDDATIGGDLAVTGGATAADLSATDDLTVTDDATITDDLSVGGMFTILTGPVKLTSAAVSLTSPTVTFSAADRTLVTLTSDANQTAVRPTGGVLGQVLVIVTGAGSNTIRFDDGASTIIGGNITLTEGQGDSLTLVCTDAGGAVWAAVAAHDN